MAGGRPALWSYSNGAPPPYSESEGDSDTGVEAPSRKRRRQLQRPPSTVINLDDSEPEEASEPDIEDEKLLRSCPIIGAEGLSQDSALPSLALEAPRQRAPLDAETRLLLERNSAAVDRLQRAAREEPIDLLSSSEDEVAPTQSAPQSPAVEEEQKMHLVVVCKGHRKVMQMAPSKPLTRLFDAWRRYAEAETWIAADTQLRFIFDGDPLTGDETPTGLDLDDQDVIEVTW